MPQPKKKTTKSIGRIRRGSKKIASAELVECSNCKKKKTAHQVCPHCGYYKGEKVTSSS